MTAGFVSSFSSSFVRGSSGRLQTCGSARAAVYAVPARRPGMQRRSEVQMETNYSGTKTFEIKKPLGAILEELESGNVFVSKFDGDSNAAKAGLTNGDVILGINGAMYKGKGLEPTLEAIKNSRGDTVKLLVERTIVVQGEANIDEDLKERLKSEISAPYRQNWIGIIIVIVLLLIVAGRFAGIR
mmetsp:Transcript_528/g.1806  ORF Transcript_528/g.1806 Transcript_528/m.1806 type:complete len:185 (-) Transcript_528:1323-1877(-)